MEISAMKELCKMYYDEKTFKHAERVAEHARDLYELFHRSSMSPSFIFNLGLAHDLYEDTSIARGVWFDKVFEDNLKLLTKDPYENYIDYIKKIRQAAKEDPYYFPAYVVKLADMHDHLAQTETLTDRLKNKYLTALPYLI